MESNNNSATDVSDKESPNKDVVLSEVANTQQLEESFPSSGFESIQGKKYSSLQEEP